MATATWNGAAGDGNFSTAGNYVLGAAPGNSDTVIFNSGNVSVTAVTTTTLTGIILIVTPNYGGNIGTSTTPLVQASFASIRFAGTGNAHYIGCGGTVTTASFEHGGDVVVNLTSGTWTAIVNSRGKLMVGASAIVTALTNFGMATVSYNGTRITTLISIGETVLYRGAQTTSVLGGTLTQYDNGQTNYLAASENSGSIGIYGGATYNKRSGGSEVTINLFPGGTLNTSGNSGGSTGTVTLGSTAFNRYLGSNLNVVNTPGVTFSYTLTSVGAAPMGGGGVGEFG